MQRVHAKLKEFIDRHRSRGLETKSPTTSKRALADVSAARLFSRFIFSLRATTGLTPKNSIC